jgi:N-acetylglutamate synthase-like GNAT family acetyltransferase
MEGPRAPSEQEYSEIVKFLDQTLRPGASWSITNEYPTALNEKNVNNLRIIKENDTVLSHALVHPIVVKTPIGLFKVGAIGSVVTDEKYRNKGHSRKVLEDCVEFAKAQGCDFAILWSNLYEFYQKLDFELAGSEISTIIDKEIPCEQSSLRFHKGSNIDPTAFHKLYTKHTVNSVRTFEDIKKYFQIPNTRIYTAWNAANNLMAYAVEGKGADLNGYIHEWGGGVSSILPLLNHIRKDQNRDITLITPFHSQNLVRRLRENGFKQHEGFLGMIRILNHENFFNKIRRHARNDLGISDFSIEKTEDSYRVHLLDTTFSIHGEHNLTRIVFGPWLKEDLKTIDDASRRTLGTVLPIRMWLWGWDSV